MSDFAPEYEKQLHHGVDIYYRIGTQVHDHEARIRLLERDSVMMIEKMTRLTDAVDSIQQGVEKAQERTDRKLDSAEEKIDRTEAKIDGLGDKLTVHVVTDGSSLRRLFASSLIQFLAVAGGIVYLIVETKFNG